MHAQNWRKHDVRQRNAYHAFRERLGEFVWLIPVLFNRQTGNLLDGQMRVEEALKHDEPLIPVRVIEVDEITEKLILQFFDAIGNMAQADDAAMQALITDNRKLLTKISTKSSKFLQQLSKDMSASFPTLKRTNSVHKDITTKPKLDISSTPDATRTDGTYVPSEEQSILEETLINNHVKFSSTNPYELPDLLPDKLASIEDLPMMTYTGSVFPDNTAYFDQSQRPFKIPLEFLRTYGVLGFYTDDWRFEQAFANADIFAETLKQEAWRAIIAPDFSAYTGWPFPEQLYNIYRSRWCARLWQELGFKIIPSLANIGPRTMEVIYSTLPVPCPIFAIQARSAEPLYLIDFLRSAIKHLQPQGVMIYGGPAEKYIKPYLQEHLPGFPNIEIVYSFLPDAVTARKGIRKRKIEE